MDVTEGRTTISISIATTRARITAALNESGLPASVMQLILTPIKNEVDMLAAVELERDNATLNGSTRNEDEEAGESTTLDSAKPSKKTTK